jgi:tight adherence protein B
VTALAAVLGAATGVGAVVVALGLRGAAPTRRVALSRAWPWPATVVPGAVALAVLAVTRWPVLALLVAAGAAALPRLLSGARRRTAARRSEAVAQWIEMVRDTLAGAAGLEEAIVVSSRRPPTPIAADVHRLATRLEHRPLTDAVAAFAREVDDPTADLLAAALITAATCETRDVGRLLAALVDATRAQAAMRASVDAGRAQVRSSTRLVLGVTAVFTGALLLFSRDYLAPYATVEGQLWLLLVGGVVAASLTFLVRLDRVDLPATPLVAVDDRSTQAEADR